jgi:hypothetical protein
VEKCKSVRISDNEGRSVFSNNITLSREHDIAYLRINKLIGLNPSFSKLPPETGDSIYAVGAPIDGLSLTKGRLFSTFQDNRGDWLEITVPADHGNSGGPVFSESGLVGMVISKDFTNSKIYAYTIKLIEADYGVTKAAATASNPELKEVKEKSYSPLLTQLFSASIAFIFGLLAGVALSARRARRRSKKRIRIEI